MVRPLPDARSLSLSDFRSRFLRRRLARLATLAAGLPLAASLWAGNAQASCEPWDNRSGDTSSVSAPGFTAPDLPASQAWPAFGEVADFSVEHVVARGDSLTAIGARYGQSVRRVAETNGLDPRARLEPGQRLIVCSRHLAPRVAGLDDGIVINVPQRMAFRYLAGRLDGAWPVAVGRPDWPTPTGDFTVRTREQDKTWYVPVSIQEEMRREGRAVLTQVPPGPENPLGRHWIGLSLPAIGIHGTNAPASVYGFRSHGCIRMHPDDVAALFDRVSVGERGRIVYEPLLLARDARGRIWFEANPDAYRRGGGTIDTVRAMARERGIAEESLDWAQVDRMLRERDGLAREVGLVSDGFARGSYDAAVTGEGRANGGNR